MQHQVGKPVELKLRGTVYAVTIVNIGPHRYAVTVAHGGVEGQAIAPRNELILRQLSRRVVEHRYMRPSGRQKWALLPATRCQT